MTDADRPRVILATSNGTGMGHLARAAATALACEDIEPIIFSLSRALPLVAGLGLRCEYCPSRGPTGMTDSTWQHYLAARLQALVNESGARVVAFDGAWPYAGLQIARARLAGVAFVWIRRGMWQPGVNEKALRQRRMFDRVVEPGELAGAADHGATADLGDALVVSPVTLLERVTRLPRQQAARELGLDPGKPTALVTLRAAPGPAGGTDDADPGADPDAARAAVRAVLATRDWQVAMTSTSISPGELGVDDERVVTLRGVFPLARYLAAFNVAVTEAGYNSFHEVLHAGLPSLIVPTRAAVTDDQTGRARWAEREGLALAAAESEPGQVANRADHLLLPETRESLAARCASLPAPRGAAETAAELAALAEEFTRHRFSTAERSRTARLHLRPLAVRAASALPGGLGKRLARSPANPAAPEFTGDLAEIETATEHIPPGASATYRATRERIAAHYYGALGS
ncbi:glycosyltransferase [Haloechinothrix sp. LS1_15]|uniref:glycosyltransferase n=1 Tax=Haloechinothrix sp. LS1_15 TaxID=2652248 RepID=UPI002944EED4|nr:glycosyltransferase [Haloechinothrix sp. LS1_15]MDV6011087.1 UDP-N-acetylglucosamine--LPS N-acetylglucosamine transferase [Haloechinothrix sp. LS1_15]